MYKKHCGFREKINSCNFKKEDCNKEKCDMYNIDWNSKSIKTQLNKLQEQVKSLMKELLKLKKLKKFVLLERKDINNEELKEYKQKLLLIKDLGKGVEYLQKAYMFCKRSGK